MAVAISMAATVRSGLALATALIALAAALPQSAIAAPDTAITAGPQGQSTVEDPSFEFGSDDPAASFECSLDDGPFAFCESPHTTPSVGVGDHVMRVRAVISTTDETPAERRWTFVGSGVAPPAIRFGAPARPRVLARMLKRFAGTASAGARVTRVEVAFRMRRFDDRMVGPDMCRFVRLRDARQLRRACLAPPWLKADGTDSWSLKLSKRFRKNVAPGQYWLMVRARNAIGNATIKRRLITVLKPL
jgi:hypothetical protein